jgi:glucose-1-phosphatase
MNAQAVIFDFGRVLGSFNKDAAAHRLAFASPYSPEEVLQIIQDSGLERQLESGQISETVFCNEVLYRCKIGTLTVPDIMRIWGNIFSPNSAVIPVVEQLIKHRVPLGVLSNTNGIHWPFIMDLPVMQVLNTYGAAFTLSYEVGGYKPDATLYETALKRLGTKPEETLYLDDIRAYVDAARALGMQAEQYDCTKDPSAITDIMQKHGLL